MVEHSPKILLASDEKATITSELGLTQAGRSFVTNPANDNCNNIILKQNLCV